MTPGMRRVLTITMAATLFLAATAVWAQQQQQGQSRFQGRGGFSGGFQSPGSDWFGLLANAKVQKELELLDEQKTDLKKIGDELQAKRREAFEGINFREMTDADREKLRTRSDALAKETRRKLEEVLLAEQVARLKEISIQVRGASALNDPEVAKALDITDEQKAQIEKVREDMGPKYREAFGGNREENEKKMAALRKESSDKTLAVLSAAQKEKFEKMKGEKLDIDPSELNRFGGGGPGGTPRRRPNDNN